MEITKADFDQWMNHTVTRSLFDYLTDLSITIEDSLINPDNIISSDYQVKAARSLGQLEAINLLTRVKFEDIQEDTQ